MIIECRMSDALSLEFLVPYAQVSTAYIRLLTSRTPSGAGLLRPAVVLLLCGVFARALLPLISRPLRSFFETSEECTCFFSRMAPGRGKLPQPTKGRSTARYSVVVAGGLLSIANQHTECHSHRCLLVLWSGSIHFTPPDFLLADRGRRRRTEQTNATLP